MSIRGGLRVLLVIVVIYLLVAALAWGFQRSLIYLPDAATPDPTTQPETAAEIVLETDDDLRLDAWLVQPTANNRDAAVLVANGNAGHRGHRAPLAERLAEEGFAVLLFDYRGYGGNPGSPNEDGLYADARAAYAYLTDEAGFPEDRILLLGESLGGGVVSQLAVENSPSGTLLRSPFVDLAAVGQSAFPIFPVRLLLWDRYPVAENMARADTPLTVVYGTDDSIVPPQQSRDVADAAERAGVDVTVDAVDDVDHNHPALTFGSPVIDATVELADRVGLGSGD